MTSRVDVPGFHVDDDNDEDDVDDDCVLVEAATICPRKNLSLLVMHCLMNILPNDDDDDNVMMMMMNILRTADLNHHQTHHG